STDLAAADPEERITAVRHVGMPAVVDVEVSEPRVVGHAAELHTVPERRDAGDQAGSRQVARQIAVVEQWTRFERGDAQAAFRQDLRRPAAGGTEPDDHRVVAVTRRAD